MQKLEPGQRLAVEQHLPLVGEVLHSLGQSETDAFYEDCYAAGCLALCRAALRWSGDYLHFAEYARGLIAREIRNVLAAESREYLLRVNPCNKGKSNGERK